MTWSWASIAALLSVAMDMAPTPTHVSAAKGEHFNTKLRRAARYGTLDATTQRNTNTNTYTHATTTSRILQPPPPPPPPEKEMRCMFLTPSSKGTKAPAPTRRRRQRRRNLAAPDVPFVEQYAEQVYIDTDIDTAIVPPGKADGPPPPPGGKGKGKGVPAPPGFKWDYDTPSGKYDPKYTYEECEYPSATPSSSPRPSTKPSLSPSRSPTDQPSPSPSASPTISHQPSVSMLPTLSAQPSSSPTMEFSPGCYNLANGGIVKDADDVNNVTMKFEPDYQYGFFSYQLVTELSQVDLTEQLQAIDEALLDVLTQALIWCGTGTRRRLLDSQGRGLMDEADPFTVIDGISMNGIDSPQSDQQCQDPAPAGYICRVYRGDFTVWARRSTHPTHDGLNNVILTEIKHAIDGSWSNNTRHDHLSQRIDGVHDMLYGAVDKPTTNENPSGIMESELNDSPVAAQGVSATGVAISSILAFVVLLFVFAAVRKREHHKFVTAEEIIDDDQSLFGKSLRETDGMSSNHSNHHWRQQRGAHVLGEDDSVYSVDFDSQDIVADIRMAESSRLYGMGLGGKRPLGPQEDDLGGTGEALNVHTCTSATCPICKNAQSPTFVEARSGSGGGNVLSPIAEVSTSREICTPCNPDDENEDGRDLRTPTYSDTVDMDMAERNYQSPDTVEF